MIFLNNFILKIREFMAGRNGPDKLSYGLLVVYCACAAVKIFLRNSYWGYIVVTVLQYALLGYIIFRIMSRNLQKRYNENFRFEQLVAGWKPYFEHLKLRITFFKTHRFRTCRHCGEFLRLKKSRGTREVTCPKCGKASRFRFLF